ncbi:MAG: hypothetical protein ACK4FK_03665 [Ferrovibrio sp.]|uniref:hypothetical protein n=1 Tax=Ferrovibrio sp. TaxID=1917215 RepID=UPI00391C104E
MVAEIAGNAVPRSLLATREALAGLKTPRVKTEAEQKLDEILHELKSSKGKAAQEAARRKLEQIKARLEALKLAAGSAAATGDARLARKVAKEIRDAARELGRALAAAGGSSAASLSGAAAAGAASAASAAETKASGEKSLDAAKAAGAQVRAAATGDDLAGLKGETLGLLKELRKIMRKLRETGLHPGIPPKERAEMERMFAEAERELAGLRAVAASPAGGMALTHGVDVSA